MPAAPRPARMKGTLQTSRLAVPKGHSQHLGSGGVPIHRRIGKAARHSPPTRYATVFSLPHLQAGARARTPCVLCKADADGAGVQAIALGESLFGACLCDRTPTAVFSRIDPTGGRGAIIFAGTPVSNQRRVLSFGLSRVQFVLNCVLCVLRQTCWPTTSTFRGKR